MSDRGVMNEAMWARLLTAAETLVTEEALQLRVGDFSAVAATQARIGSIFERLVSGAPTAGAAERARVADLNERRNATAAWLRAELGRVGAELGAARRRTRELARFTPAYAATAGRATRWEAVG